MPGGKQAAAKAEYGAYLINIFYWEKPHKKIIQPFLMAVNRL